MKSLESNGHLERHLRIAGEGIWLFFRGFFGQYWSILGTGAFSKSSYSKCLLKMMNFLPLPPPDLVELTPLVVSLSIVSSRQWNYDDKNYKFGNYGTVWQCQLWIIGGAVITTQLRPVSLVLLPAILISHFPLFRSPRTPPPPFRPPLPCPRCDGVNIHALSSLFPPTSPPPPLTSSRYPPNQSSFLDSACVFTHKFSARP